MFSTGEVVIYGVHPNGTMEAYCLANWRDPSLSPIEMMVKKVEGEWRGPVPVPGLNFNTFTRLPTYGVEPPLVK